MSQSKASGSAKAKTKSTAAKKKPAAVETVRIIEAPVAAPGPDVPLTAAEQALSDRAKSLAADIERALKASDNGQAAVLHPEAVQDLIATLCKVYSAHVENGTRYGAFSQKNPVTPTDVMVTASGLLNAANLAVFELGMWQSWTGR